MINLGLVPWIETIDIGLRDVGPIGSRSLRKPGTATTEEDQASFSLGLLGCGWLFVQKGLSAAPCNRVYWPTGNGVVVPQSQNA